MAALSFLFPVFVVVLFVLPSGGILSTRSTGILMLAALVGWLAVRTTASILAPKLTPTEAAVLRFWSFGPHLAVALFIVLRTPTWLLSAVGASEGWLASNLSFVTNTLTVVIGCCAAAGVWALWRRHWNAIRLRVEPPAV
ncbi:MAG: hypothetical protein M5U32_02385 [Myxococcota bacterium]|nr:hypothetical protein [Myxococcota bacterium]